MHTTTKGALAVGAAAVLLLGGAGTIAYWTDEGDADAGDISTGSLSISDGTCDASWSYASGSDQGSPVGSTGIVPGDSIAKTCTFTIAAEGDHLSAAPTLPDSVDLDPAASGTLVLDVAASYTLDGVAFDESDRITEADDGAELAALIVVTMPFGDTTTINTSADTQGITQALDDLTVTLTQETTGANPNT